MKLLMAYVEIKLLTTLRNRSAFFFNLIFPLLLYLAFSHSYGTTAVDRIASLVMFVNYSVQTVFLISLGMSISNSRSSQWIIYLRTLPASTSINISAMVIEKLFTAFISLFLVLIASIVIHGIIMGFGGYVYLIISALIGGIPFAFLAIAIGYRFGPDAVRPLLVFLNLGLLFASFVFPDHGWLSIGQTISPTFHWMNIVLNHYTHKNLFTPWGWMVGYGIVFYLLAIWSYRSRRNFRTH